MSVFTDNMLRIKPYGHGSFSGADMLVSILLPSSSPIAIGECSTVTYSTLRDVQEVRTLGRITVRGFAKGQRRVAGTIIFTLFEQHAVHNIRAEIDYLRQLTRLKSDEMPPFDIIITAASEYGRASRAVIYGAVVLEDGMVMSIEDILTENTWTYMARDIDLFRAHDYVNFSWPKSNPSTVFNDPRELGRFSVSEIRDRYITGR